MNIAESLRAELGRLVKMEEVEAENHAARVSRVRWSFQLDQISLAVRQVGARWRAMSSGAVPTFAAEMTERSSARSVDPADFYARIPVFESFARLADPALYRPLPEDWVIGLSDVVASTEAIRAGKYKSVNVAGAALIAAVSNALSHRDFAFTFGGDGAAFAVPPEYATIARAALAETAAWVRDDLALTLRVALIPMASIRAEGWDVQVARYAPSPHVSYAMFTGGGMAWAVAKMKAGLYAVEPAPPGTRPDLTGLSCRWQEFPARQGVMLSLIAVPVRAGSEGAFPKLVGDILRLVSQEAGDGHPIINPMRVSAWPPAGLDFEARATRMAHQPLVLRKLELGLQSFVSWILSRFCPSWTRIQSDRYIDEMVVNADFRKYDDALRMTIDCTPALANQVETRLQEAECARVARYGLHRQDAAIVTCFTPSPLSSNHVHFIDGAAGGYTTAAARMKSPVGKVAKGPI